MQRILTIDDSRMVRKDIRRALSGEGYEVLDAGGPMEGIRYARHHTPDVILLDVMMSEMNGVGVLRELQFNFHTADIPVVIVSSLSEPSQVAALVKEGAHSHVAKPFTHADLRERVRSVLESAGPRENTARRGRVVGFIGAKGGVGTTTLAVNVAGAWMQQAGSVAVVELRSQFGTLTTQLNIAPALDLNEVLSDPPEDVTFAEELMIEHATGLQIVAGPQHVRLSHRLDPQHVEKVIRRVSAATEITALDLSGEASEANAEAIRLSDEIVLVVEREWTSIEAGRRMRGFISESGIGLPVRAAVVTRSLLSKPPTLEEIGDALNVEVSGVVPVASEGLALASDQGAPLVLLQPDDPAAAAYTEIARQLIPASAAVTAASAL